MNKKIKTMLTLVTFMSLAGCSLNNTSTSSNSINGSTNISNSELSSSIASTSSNSSSTKIESSSSSNSSSTTPSSPAEPSSPSTPSSPAEPSSPSSPSDSSSSNNSKNEWDAELAELMETHIGETIPYVQLNEESLEYYYYEDDYGYPIVAIFDESDVNLLVDYDDILLEAGYKLEEYYDADYYGYEIYFYSKGNVLIQYDYYPGDEEYAAGNEIYVTVLELEEEPEPGDSYSDPWPTALIESYFNGVSVPSVPNVTNYLVTDYMDFVGLLAIECAASDGIEESYMAALEAEGFTVQYDSSYEQYSATEATNSVQVDFYCYEGAFTVILSEPVVALPSEWPEDLISSYYGVSIPQPLDATVKEVVDYYEYDETVVIEIEGDISTLEAYAIVLEAAGYSIEAAINTSYNAECIRAINPEKTVRVDLMLTSTSVIIEIGHYSEQTETPDPIADMRETVIAELCMSLYGASEGKYYFDEEYGCYYTTAIFGTQFDASTTYSTLLSILPSELCYAYSEDPIVDTYNDQDQYINVFFDADYTVAVECVCYFYSESYGYVAQISVYNFDDYFAS